MRRAPTEWRNFQLCNERDRNGRVYGSIACRGPSQTDEHNGAPVEAAKQALNARISGNQALSHWLRQMTLGLQRIGPWSSAVISE